MKVLVVEDDAFNQEVAKELITMLCPNVEVEIAGNGKEALAKMQENEFDLVFSDIDMPEMNGIELVKEIKSRFPNLPVVALTAFAVVGDKERLLLEGFDDYVSKPIEIQELQRVISKYLLSGD